jgi:dinuclear metal center YbgI/SA1388 family protein
MTSSVPESSSSNKTATLAQVIAHLNELYPPRLAEEWDKVGLSVGDVGAPVRKIYFALDAVTETITEALDWGADLMFTHHPFLFSPLDAVATTTDRGHNVHRLIRGDCAVFSAHTNGDAARGGVNDVLALALGVRGTTPIAPSIDDDTLGLGRVGDLPAPVTLREFAEDVARALPETAQGVRVAGDPTKEISRVAVLGGSGGSMLNEAVKTGADVYVTSDLKHHDLVDFLEAQRNAHVIAGASREEVDERTMAVVDVAHFASESPWLATAARAVQGVLAGAGFEVDVMVSDLSTDPWTFAQ